MLNKLQNIFVDSDLDLDWGQFSDLVTQLTITENCENWIMTLRVSDLPSDSDPGQHSQFLRCLLLVLNIKWQNGLETKSTYFEPKIRYCSNLCSIFCLCRSPGPHQINQIIRYLIWSILITSTNTTSEYREYMKNLAKSKNITNKPREYQEYYRNKHEWSIHKLSWLWMTNLQVISCRKMEDMLYLHSGMD